MNIEIAPAINPKIGKNKIFRTIQIRAVEISVKATCLVLLTEITETKKNKYGILRI